MSLSLTYYGDLEMIYSQAHIHTHTSAHTHTNTHTHTHIHSHTRIVTVEIVFKFVIANVLAMTPR